MALMWQYAEVSGNPRWKGMAWGMMPALGSAMAACTWHFFYNSPDLDFLVGWVRVMLVTADRMALGAAAGWWWQRCGSTPAKSSGDREGGRAAVAAAP
jgi:hypothetical protein